MIITSSHIQLSTEHQQIEISQQHSSQQAFLTQLSAARLGRAAASASPTRPALSAPPGLLDLLVSNRDRRGGASAAASLRPSALWDFHSSSARLFQALIDAIAGRINPLQAAATELTSAAPAGRTATATAQQSAAGGPLATARQRVITVDVSVREYRFEEECTRFCASGSVVTADGAQLDLNLNLAMYRRFEATTEYQRSEAVVFTDPLVVNFDGHAAELTEEQYAFDLDSDGASEWISFVTASSGLLALDRNGDGQINDGSELFGAVSGDGFADLAAYDQDHNGFIDAADAIFADLKIWRKAQGEDRLETLEERHLGAIYLGASDTPFTLKDAQNQTQGRVRQSGIYLDETGGVGSVQQIDMAV